MFVSMVINEFEKTADFTQGEVAMKGHENDAERFAEDVFKRRISFHFQFFITVLEHTWGLVYMLLHSWFELQ